MVKLSGSIVLYKNDANELLQAINSFLNIPVDVKLYLIDNSPTNELKNMITDSRLTYIHNPSNPGFGAAHNLALDMVRKNKSDYHFIINPDVYFQTDVVTPMVNYMINHPDVGMLMPEVLYPDGSIQNLPKLLPAPFSILLRKLKRPAGYYQKFIDKYELRFVNRDAIYDAPILSGCFTLLNMQAIEKIGGYDDTFFMYFEDWDLCRRMGQAYRTVYFPEVSVFHGYDSGANKSFRLFKIFIKSACHYFNKWGWFFDRERRMINTKVLTQFKQ